MFRTITEVLGPTAKVLETEAFLDWAELHGNTSPAEMGSLIVQAEALPPQRGWYSAEYCQSERIKIEYARQYLRTLIRKYDSFLQHRDKIAAVQAQYAEYDVRFDGEAIRVWDGEQLIDKVELN